MSGIGNSIEQMTQGHLRNVQQLAVFFTGHGNVYAINIAKVKAFIITEEVTINETPSETPIIAGIATIRGEPVTLINLDTWLGAEPMPIEDYKLIIYCEFSHRRVGFLIKDMINIVEKTTDELRPAGEANSKITYTTYVTVDKKDELCTVFNAEQLLTDIGWNDAKEDVLNKYVKSKLTSKQLILAAEDSAVAQDILTKFFKKVGAKFEIYNNGQLLMNRVKELDASEIGMILTDIEMPEADGYQVAQFVKSKFPNVPVVVNSSMTTDAVRHKMRDIGVDDFIGKTDIEKMYEVVTRYLD